MPVLFFKRHRMQIDLRDADLELPDNPICFLPWAEDLIGMHSIAKWESFRLEMDASVFPCLGDRDGCKQLMRDLSKRSNFVPGATWLGMSALDGVPAGTIQGLRLDGKRGAIQNVGVVPDFRGMGVGKKLLILALKGFRDSGCTQVQLEVTVHNLGAIRLYESVGFRYYETVFKVGNIPVIS